MKQERLPIFFPDWMPKEAWDGFEKMRRKQKKPLTDRARICVVNTLAKLREQGEEPEKVLDQSTVNCWLDVFPLREHRNGNGNGKKTGLGYINGLLAKSTKADEQLADQRRTSR